MNDSREIRTKMIAVIDYGMGNLRSIHNALMMANTPRCLDKVLLSCVCPVCGVTAMRVAEEAFCMHIFQNFNKGFEPKS